jgi:propionyl-CoA carboxylase alpha chain
VEHPVTEWITGLDLVEQQIRVARGEKLAFSQDDLKINGHAIELRVCAEDPLNNFLPSVGKLTTYTPPLSMEQVRVDDGYEEGMEVPIFYDPLLSKLIAWGKNREEAIKCLSDAIHNYAIEGVATTLPFGKFVLQHPAFKNGQFDTHFVKQFFTPEALINTDESEIAAMLALQLYLEGKNELAVPQYSTQDWILNR